MLFGFAFAGTVDLSAADMLESAEVTIWDARAERPPATPPWERNGLPCFDSSCIVAGNTVFYNHAAIAVSSP
jgi:hypothetical protein